MFVGKAGAYPEVEQLKGASLGKALALPTNLRLGWKGLSGTPNSSLYRTSVHDGSKCFYNIGLRCQSPLKFGVNLITPI
jgi:hypothetical protein